MAGQDHPYRYEYVGMAHPSHHNTGLVCIVFRVDGWPSPLTAQFSVDDAKRLLADLPDAIGAADPSSS